MKRTVASSVLPLLFLAMFEVLVIGALANFSHDFSYLPEIPNTTKPVITVQSSCPNQTYDAASITYSIRIENPASWYSNTTGERIAGELLDVRYTIDGERNVTIAPHLVSRYLYDYSTGEYLGQNPDYVELPTDQVLTLEGSLTDLASAKLSPGEHTVQVWTHSISQYSPPEAGPYYPVLDTKVYATTEIVTFYVTNGEMVTKPKPFPTLVVASASVVVATVVASAVLIYLKKREEARA